jgi:hypothetical protein
MALNKPRQGGRTSLCRYRTQEVAGSSPASSITKLLLIAYSIGERVRACERSIFLPSTKLTDHFTRNAGVLGSSPAVGVAGPSSEKAEAPRNGGASADVRGSED